MEKEQRNLNTISCDIADLNTIIGLIQNYISCLQLQSKNIKNSNDAALLYSSLVHENGLDNIMETLNQLSEKISLAADELLDYSEMAVTLND